jgi:prevent-host-death family protein
MAYTVHQAKTHFSRLLKEAESGHEVIVMRGRKPVAKIVAIAPPDHEPEVPFRLLGAYRGKMS